ncbi:MAG: glycosyl hydrolase [Lentisphaerota bacterium]
MKIIAALINKCEKLGMNYHLYDEGGFPSGGACGQVLKSNPEKFARSWVVSQGECTRIEKEEYHPEISAPYPDLLAQGVTEKFIELTHDAHRKIASLHFGKTIRFVFTDEPQMSPTVPGHRLTWTEGLDQVFRRKKGYSIEPYLSALVKETLEHESRELQQVRVDFQEVCGELFLKRFLLPIRKWCRANGLLSGGHVNNEDDPAGNIYGGYGNILQALRAMDLPGVDVIWRQLFPGKENFPFAKYASSAAHQTGNPLIVAEIFAVYGNGLQPDQMKWLVNYLLVRGVNLFVLSMIMQSSYNNWMCGCRPHYGDHEPLWKYMDIFHNALARSSYLLSRGKPYCRTAFYYDIRAIHADGKPKKEAIRHHLEISEKMLEKQCDFDYIDDSQLAAAKISSGILRIGKMCYDTLVLPPTEWMTRAAIKKLEDFKASAGKVIDFDNLEKIIPLLTITPQNRNIRVCKRIIGEKALYFLVNESEKTVRVKIELSEKESVVFCNPEDGIFYSFPSENGCFEWVFEPCSSAFFMTGVSADANLRKFNGKGDFLELNDGWNIRAVFRSKPGKHEYEYENLKTSAIPASTGDWRKFLGDDFSGDAVYSIDFGISAVLQNAVLDLGKVAYACSVVLNGKYLGKRFFSPHRFEIGEALRKGQNHLEVTVSNTFANALSPEGVKEYWRKNCPPISSYEDRQRVFEMDSLESGLFGPVKINIFE